MRICLRLLILLTAPIALFQTAYAQTGSVRGAVFDAKNGEPLPFARVEVTGAGVGAVTDANGLYRISKVPSGTQTLRATSLGFDVMEIQMAVPDGGIVSQSFYLKVSAATLQQVEISAQKDLARTQVQISRIAVTPQEIRSLPSVGGVPDIAQYITTLPGIVSSGDQGGQIFIRGGAPVQNKILLDGMTIYNPFHSIGFFSVFETEALRSADVYTGGFGAEYGGRTSAIIDLKTKEGDRKKASGMAAISPFQAKVLVEAPISKLGDQGGGSSSFLLTYKQSLIDQTGKNLYKYAAKDSAGLPFAYNDLYGKLSFNGANGGKLNLFGFNFNDHVSYTNVADLKWQNTGYGANFILIPPGSATVLGGSVAYSKYQINLQEGAQDPRLSSISSFSATLDFTYAGEDSELKYGAELTNLSTNLQFANYLGFTFDQTQNSSEISAFARYRKTFGSLVIEPGLRLTRYTALSENVLEPRFAAKINLTGCLRLKFSGGLYSQNLLSTVSEKDIVNLFVGYLTGPQEQLYKPGVTSPNASSDLQADTHLQTAYHLIGGVEFDPSPALELNIEPYLKKYTQLIDVNRNKIVATDLNYLTETGTSAGVDFSGRYHTQGLDVRATYSYSKVTLDDGVQSFPSNFDRRHNVNLLATYTFGKNKAWEAAARWNYGTGFPFTQTRGFYSFYDFKQGLNTDVITGNANIGVIYSPTRNGGRLPDYSRLDLSLKRTFRFSGSSRLEITASATNATDRNNIFYFDRVRYARIDQLPILPSLALGFWF